MRAPLTRLPAFAVALALGAALATAPGMGPAPEAPLPEAPASEAFVIDAGSRFWIEGTSSVSAFTCEARQVAGAGTVEPGAAAAGAARAEVEAVVAVAVRAFDCGVGPMNRDLYAALKARQHPGIRFILTGAEVVAPSEAGASEAGASEAGASEAGASGAWTTVRAWGTLTLAGAARPVVVTAEGRRLGARGVALRGAHALRMTDFGIDPPTGLLGLVRAHDEVTVRFDLVATAAGTD